MDRTLSEQAVLKKLGISDFRHMSKDRIMNFVSMLPYMDPEVAKKALEQFPEYREMASRVISEYKGIVENALESKTRSQQEFYEGCRKVLDSLQNELEAESLSREDKERVENKMTAVVRMIAEKDTENKKYLIKNVVLTALVAAGIVGVSASLLGANFHASGAGKV